MPARERSSPGPDRITVANGGRYTPGSGGTGTLATNDLSLSDTSELTFTVGTPTTSGAITGALILDGTLNITQGAGFAQGTYTIFTATGGVTDNSLRLGAAPDRLLVRLPGQREQRAAEGRATADGGGDGEDRRGQRRELHRR